MRSDEFLVLIPTYYWKCNRVLRTRSRSGRSYSSTRPWESCQFQFLIGRLRESAPPLESSVTLARGLTVPRDEWLAAFALGKLLIRVGKDTEAEVAFNTAAAAIESIAAGLKTDVLIRSFVAAPSVLEVFKLLGRRASVIEPPSASLTVKAQ
jgi:hypothetical protein